MNDNKNGPNNTLLNKRDTTPIKIFRSQSKTWLNIAKRSNVIGRINFSNA